MGMEQPSLEEIFGSYVSWKIDDDTWVINFMNGSENMYLLEGTERALLIDTGYGVGNLRAYVERLTDKPIVVANTHYHPDHAAGDGEFEQAYMSRTYYLDKPAVEKPGMTPFDITKLPHPDYEKILVGEGDKIELGGRTVEVLDLKPAHCNSSLFYLDRGHRMFFCGDDMEAAQVNLFDNSKNPEIVYDVPTALRNFQDNTRKIKSYAADFDYLLPNHNGCPIAKSYLDDYIRLIDDIFAGKVTIDEKLNHRYMEMDAQASKICRIRGKKGSIITYRAQVQAIIDAAKQ